MCRPATHQGKDRSLAAMPTCKRAENKSATCKTTTGHVAAFDAADPDGRRAPSLHSRGETTYWWLLQLFELSRRGSNPLLINASSSCGGGIRTLVRAQVSNSLKFSPLASTAQAMRAFLVRWRPLPSSSHVAPQARAQSRPPMTMCARRLCSTRSELIRFVCEVRSRVSRASSRCVRRASSSSGVGSCTTDQTRSPQ